MSKSFNSLALLALIGAAMVSSCSKDTDLYDSNLAQKEYEANWTEKFGEVAADQDWNLATRCTANVDLTGITGASSVKVYSSMPGGSDVQLIANYPASTTSFSFDYVKGASDVYVVVEDADGYQLLSGYYDINNGAVSIGASTKATRSWESCDVSLTTYSRDGFLTGTEKQNNGNYSFKDEQNAFTDLHFNEYSNYVAYASVFDLYSLNNASSMINNDGIEMKISDIFGIVGTGGVFKERQGANTQGTQCNLLKWEDELKPKEGAKYTVANEGEVVLDYFYKGTDNIDVFGYAYCTNANATIVDFAKAPKYIISDNLADNQYLKGDGSTITGYQQLNGYTTDWENNKTDHTVKGSKIKLVYFGEDGKGTGSYTFPKGTQIIFFITLGNTSDWQYSSMSYSLPQLNKLFGSNVRWKDLHPLYDGTSFSEAEGLPTFITYKYGGKVIMGLEDTSDDDMNDMLFYIDNVESSTIPEIGKKTEGNSWIIACEDLGSTDDYDFNDVVVKVSYVAGNKTLSVTPLAAGGTLKADISFLGTPLGEIHELLNGSTANADGTYPMINTQQSGSIVNTSSMTFGDSIPLGVQEDFTLSSESNSDGADNMGGFTITVSDEKGAKTIKAPTKGSVPQMFVVPGTWAWPTERTGIETAYPNFKEWVSNAADYEWWK